MKMLLLLVGEPIPVEKVEMPTAELINELHQTYMDRLSRLYDDYNLTYGKAGVELKFM